MNEIKASPAGSIANVSINTIEDAYVDISIVETTEWRDAHEAPPLPDELMLLTVEEEGIIFSNGVTIGGLGGKKEAQREMKRDTRGWWGE